MGSLQVSITRIPLRSSTAASDEELGQEDAAKKIRNLLAQAHRRLADFEDQDDFDRAVFGLQREKGQSLLQFANVARFAFPKADSRGHPCRSPRTRDLPHESRPGSSAHPR